MILIAFSKWSYSDSSLVNSSSTISSDLVQQFFFHMILSTDYVSHQYVWSVDLLSWFQPTLYTSSSWHACAAAIYSASVYDSVAVFS